MARLKGDLTQIDLNVPFSIRPGGRVFDLSKDLHFEIKWDGTNIVETFTNNMLQGAGHTSDVGPNSHVAFNVNGINRFFGFNPNLSWANDEYTLAFWVKFENVNFTTRGSLGDLQIDFIVSRDLYNFDQKKFSTKLKRNATGTGVRAYFGINNFATSTEYVSLMFLDTYDSEKASLVDRRGYTLQPYPAEDVVDSDMAFGEWNHIVIRSKNRKKDEGICELWLNGKLKSKYIPSFLDLDNRLPDKSPKAGSGVFGEKDLGVNGKYVTTIQDYLVTPPTHTLSDVYTYSYPAQFSNSGDRLYLANHSYFQIAKWDRILTDLEIEALYIGTLNNVYIERFTSISSPPRKKQIISYENLNNKNFGYFDNNKARKLYKNFDDSISINESISYLGKNIPVDYHDGEEHLELTYNLKSNIIKNNIKNNRNNNIIAFNERYNSESFGYNGASVATSVINISIPSVFREDNLQYAGRTDSKFASLHTVKGSERSMLLSSSLYRHGISGSNQDAGIAGTGFLYYSPTKKCWIEKRPQHETSLGVNTYETDNLNATNVIEINPYTVYDADGGWLDLADYNASVVRRSTIMYYLSKMQITGTHNILRQFTASPQLSYFTNNKEDLLRSGYTNIGSPTVAFGAPFAPKYHAFDDETIKLNQFIDGPFSLKKVILKIPVEICRRNEVNQGAYKDYYTPVAYFNFENNASSPSTVEDLTGNSHVATLVNSAQVIDSDTPENIAGRGCLDLTFNASSTSNTDRLLISDASDLRLSTSGLSISFWVKFVDLSGAQNHSLIYKVSTDGTLSEYYLYYEKSSDDLIFRINKATSAAYNDGYQEVKVSNVVTNSYLQLNIWHHVVITFGGDVLNPGTDMKIYIDAEQKDDGVYSSDNWSSGDTAKSHTYNLMFGSRGNVDISDLRGKIASITIWNRELSKQDIKSLNLNCLSSTRYSWNWTENVTARKDLDNYVFFLYRQRRSNTSNIIDSTSDISSSERFLIGSGSLCVYNSSSFGLAKNDGFIDIFGVDTPITGTDTNGNTFKKTLNQMFRSSSLGKNPYDIEGNTFYEKISAPLHGPSLAFDAQLNDTKTNEVFIEKKYIELEITPSFNLGGFSNNTLMYITTSKGHLSTSFADVVHTIKPAPDDEYNPAFSNRIFNWYPQTGSYDDLNTKKTPNITTIFQDFWFGGTRQPKIMISESNGDSLNNVYQFINIGPHYKFDKGVDYLNNNNMLSQFKTPGADRVEFDIEIARAGLSYSNYNGDAFLNGIQLVPDSRGKLNSLAKDFKSKIAAVFQRTETLFTKAFDDELTSYITGTFSIKEGLQNSEFVDLLSSLTTGYAPVTNKTLSVRDPYMLLPEDELVLGLDAGVTPPPDIAPYFGKNLTDANESGQHKPKQSAFINPILKEQIWHYAGNSYLRILPGDAELLLVGDYIKNEKPFLRNRSINCSEISTIVGNDPLFDTYENAETDAYISTLTSQVFSGLMTSENPILTRRVTNDYADQGNANIHTMKRYDVLNASNIIITDLYLTGVI